MAQQELGSTQLAPAADGILTLVDELLLNIIDHIDSHQALCNLAATCMRFQDLVEPYIWRSLLIITGGNARKVALALDSREARIDYVQDLAIRYKDSRREGIEELNHFIAVMPKLRNLVLESPCPNNSEWRGGVYFDGYSRIDYTNLLAGAVYPRLGIPLALPMLQSLTLHGHGPEDRKFGIGRAKAMFFHPTLRHITLSCLDFDADLKLTDDLVVQKHKSTPLQSLELIECNVNIHFLDVVLCLPKALRELSIGERLHIFPECEPSLDPNLRTSSPLFLTALQRQASSLQRLVHIGGLISRLTTRQTDTDGAAKLRSLTSLETLEIGFESHLYYYLLRPNGFPPALKTLKMLDASLSLNTRHDLRAWCGVAFRSVSTLVTQHMPPSLPPDFTLHLHFSDHNMFRAYLAATAHPDDENHVLCTLFLDRPAIYKIATVLKSYNARFVITRETFPNGEAYIPPYMYGEDLPVEEEIYDSRNYWRFDGVDYRVMDDERLRTVLREKNRLFTCLRCESDGLGVDECRNLGDRSKCLPCRSVEGDCIWNRDAVEGLDVVLMDHEAKI